MGETLAKIQQINLVLATMRDKDIESYNSLLRDAEKRIFIRKMETSVLMLELGNEIDIEDLTLVLEENEELITRELIM